MHRVIGFTSSLLAHHGKSRESYDRAHAFVRNLCINNAFVVMTCRHNIITKTHIFKYIENFTTRSWKYSDKNSSIFHIPAQNIDCGYWLEPPRLGSSNECPQFRFLSRNKINNVYPCKTPVLLYKTGLSGSKLFRYDFVMSKHRVILIVLNSSGKSHDHRT